MPVCSGKCWQVGGMAKNCMRRSIESGQSLDGTSMRCESVGPPAPFPARPLILLLFNFPMPNLASALPLTLLDDQRDDRPHRRWKLVLLTHS